MAKPQRGAGIKPGASAPGPRLTQPKKPRRGDGSSDAEVVQISGQGLRLLLGDRKLFLPFSDFPWFKEAPVSAILNVEWPQSHHLYWPDLDIDLAVESIENPERYPLISKA